MRLALLILASLLPLAVHAQAVYKWTDDRGVVQYGDRPPQDAQAERVAIAPPPPVPAVGQGSPTTQAPLAGGAPAPAAAPALDIVMYGRSDCGYCAKARRYFARRGLRYVEKDVEHDRRANAEWKRLGGTGVPVFVINHDVSRGFSEKSMTEQLARYGW
jgi:glutaredoxin